jgi:sodium-coupled monocarboxylate transporter 8/12
VTLANKLLALLYGAACIGVAFLAAEFTGILQASLTVFGVVGGPLLGLFTLGMLFPFVSQRAALSAFVTALGFGLWIGFGGPKPPLQRLSGSIAECEEYADAVLTCAPANGNSTV